jgi:hypothetical protein
MCGAQNPMLAGKNSILAGKIRTIEKTNNLMVNNM